MYRLLSLHVVPIREIIRENFYLPRSGDQLYNPLLRGYNPHAETVAEGQVMMIERCLLFQENMDKTCLIFAPMRRERIAMCKMFEVFSVKTLAL